MNKKVTFQLHQRRARQRTEFRQREDNLDRNQSRGPGNFEAPDSGVGNCQHPCGPRTVKECEDACECGDIFNRTVASGWGTSTCGREWTEETPTPANYTVSGNVGHMFHVDGGTDWDGDAIGLDISGSMPIEATFKIRRTTNSDLCSINLRLGTTGFQSNFVGLDMGTTDNTIRCRHMSSFFGGVTDSASFTYSQNTWYKVRVYVDSTTTRARIWEDIDPEPGAWNVEAITTPYEVGIIFNFLLLSFSKSLTDDSNVEISDICIQPVEVDEDCLPEIHDQDGSRVAIEGDLSLPATGGVYSETVFGVCTRVDGDTYTTPTYASEIINVTLDGRDLLGWVFEAPNVIALPDSVDSDARVYARYVIL